MVWNDTQCLTIGFGLILASLLLPLSYIDIKTFRLPNPLTLSLVLIGWLQSYILHMSFTDSLIGAVVGYSAFVAIEYGFKTLRSIEGLGRGDAKLLAAGGAWCGWSALPYIVLVASLTGLIAALFPKVRFHEKGWIPFGPFLAFSIFTVWTSYQMV